MTARLGASKHLSKGTEIDADNATIQFSPVVTRSFARLEAMVHDSPHFSSEIRENLQDLAAGKAFPVHTALTEMGLIAKETMKHVAATGDTRAEQALGDLISDVMGVGRDGDTKPVTLIAPKTRNR
jgi:hypothetical protein